MEYQQFQVQQKSKLLEQPEPSVSLSDAAVSAANSPATTGQTEGSFVAELTAAVEAYVSGTESVAEIDSTLAAIDKKNSQRSWFNRVFHNLFYGKKDKRERESLETQREEQNASAGNALTQFSSLMDAACKADKEAMIADEAIIRRIMASMPEANVKATLDSIYNEIDEAHKDLMMDAIEARYGVPVVDGSAERFARLPSYIERHYFSSKKPREWSLAALKHVYQTYALIPSAHLKKIKCLAHFYDNCAGGASFGASGVYYVNYIKDAEDAMEIYDPSWNGDNVDHCDNANDWRNGTIYLDTTLAHELGHILDASNNNYGYSKSESFRKYSEWVEIENDPDKVVNYMAESLEKEPFDNNFIFYDEERPLTDAEIKQINERGRQLTFDIGKKIVQLSPQDWTDAQAIIDTEVKAVPDLSEYDQKRYTTKLKSRYFDSNLVYHLWRGLGNSFSCYNHKDAMKGMKRPFHQGYKGEPWYSFNKDRWANKISSYQYRDPREEFAETYSSYHTAPLAAPHEVVNPDGSKQMVPYKKGERTPEGLRIWFEKEGLHRMEPDQVSGSADITKEDGARIAE